MTVHRQGEDAVSYLQEISTPNLYINNAFRVTRLEVTATLKEAKKLIKEWEQCQKLGIPHKSQQRSYFPVSSSLSVDDIKIAVDQKLSNPFRRIIEELFWFWPDPNKNLANDEALSYLRLDKDKAKSQWISSVNMRQANIIPLHNLAVLHHLQALEIEQELRFGGCLNLSCPRCKEYFRITAESCNSIITCPNCQARLQTPPPSPERSQQDEHLAGLWRDAYEFWSRLWISAQFWAELSLRAKNIDENIGQESIDQIKQRLPESLLAINAGLSIDFCSKKNYSHAIRHAQTIFSSNFSDKYHLSAIRHVTREIIDQVHQQSILAEKNAKGKPESGLKEAINLLDKTRSDIKCFDILNCSTLNLGHAACDAVAESTLNALIDYGNATGDCRSLIFPIKEILMIAKSASVKDRISRNQTIFIDNARHQEIEGNIEPLNNLCDSISQAISSIVPNDRYQPKSLYMKFRNEVIPKLNKIKDQFGPNSDEFKSASDISASCLRGISIALHNISNDMAQALESIQLAITLCVDSGLEDILLKDLRTCRQNTEEERKIRRDNTKNKYAPLMWGVGIALFVVISVIYDAKEKSSSSSTSYSRPAASKNSYFPSTSPSGSPGSQSSTRPFSSPNIPSAVKPGLSTREILAQEINAGKARLRLIESQLTEIEKTANEYQTRLDTYKILDQIESYNKLVPIYNSLLEQMKRLYAEDRQLVGDVNAKIKRYNEGY